jgi:arginyl-tRNA synthetase
MLKTKVADYLKKTICGILRKSALSPRESALAEIFVPENENFGHYSTNAALRLAKLQGKNPMEIATNIKNQISKIKNNIIERIEVAAPGFINFWLSPKVFQDELKEILKKKEKYGKAILRQAQGKKIQVEFISANPTGPLTIGNGRGGFLGDVLARVLEFSGYRISREYYVNDAKVSTQIKELGKTAISEGSSYKTKNLEFRIENLGARLKKITDYGEAGYLLAKEIQKENQKFIEKDLKIKFDNWFSEESLYQSGTVEKVLKDLEKKNLVYKKDGALWFKTKKFGDSEDRVLVRQPRLAGQAGEPTYFLSDLAYHLNKFKVRKFDKVIDIWGADHHGYLPRLKASLRAFNVSEDKLIAVITQLVRLKKGGEEVKMSKRTGEFITLKDLIEEVGLDAARFFFLMNSPDTHMDFDLDLAKEQSLKNPVYYVQYAAVRCNSILRKSEINIRTSDVPKLPPSILRTSDVQKLNLLNTSEDINLMRMLIRFPEVIEEAAKNYNPQVLVRYSLDLAREFHNFYEKERILGEKQDLTTARLELIKAARIIFKNLFELLGISLPKRM